MNMEENKLEKDTIEETQVDKNPDSDNKPKATFGERVKAFFVGAWAYIRFAKIELIIIFSAVFLDLLTKFFVEKNLDLGGEPFVLIKKFLQFRYVQNDRAAFGSGFGLDKLFGESGVMTAFIAFSSVVISVFCYMLYRFRKQGIFARIAFALIIGGAFGNFYDRIAFGYVRDFVEVVFFGFDLPFLGETFAIFNIADSALVVGMIMLMVFFLFIYKDDKSAKKDGKSAKNAPVSEQNIAQIALESEQNNAKNERESE